MEFVLEGHLLLYHLYISKSTSCMDRYHLEPMHQHADEPY